MFLVCVAFFSALLLVDKAAATGAGNVTADAEGFAPSWVKDPDGRGTWTIVYSSAVTLFFSAWVSLHLNIPKYKESGIGMVWRLTVWGLASFLFPEVIVFIAASQAIEVRQFRKDLKAIWRSVVSETSSYTKQTFSGNYSRLYAWYARMGGICVQTPIDSADGKFLLSAEDKSRVATRRGRLTLTPVGILQTAAHGFDFDISDESISDKSKSDSLAKVLVYVQILWFVCQAVQRRIAQLPMSLLEFHVLVNIGCGLVIYTMWFTKPRNIDTATVEDACHVERLVPDMLDSNGHGNFPRLCFQIGYEEKVEGLRRAAMWVVREGAVRPQPKNGDNHMDLIEVKAGPAVTVWVSDPFLMYDGAATALSQRLGKALKTRLYEERRMRTTQRDHRGPSTRSGNSHSAGLPPHPTPIHQVAPDTRSNNLFSSVLPPSVASPKPGLSSFAQEVKYSSQPYQPYPSRSDERLLDERADRDDYELANINNAISPSPRSSLSIQRHSSETTQRVFSFIRLGPECFCGRRGNFSYMDFIDSLQSPWAKFFNWVGFPAALSGYGAVHLIPDLVGFSFPTPIERLMWRISCYLVVGFIVAAPLTAVAIAILDSLWESKRRGFLWRLWQTIGTLVLVVCVLAYPVSLLGARLYLMVESFISLRRERAEIFLTPDWNWLDYIPHI